MLIGTAIGLASGYVGGTGDEVVMRLLDVLLSFPVAAPGAGAAQHASGRPTSISCFVVAVLYIPMVARVVRSMVLDLKTKEFVEAARVRGERRSYILFREILPNSLPPLLVEASMRFSYSIFLVASLGFLGLGVQPPSPDWGLQINEAQQLLHHRAVGAALPGLHHRPAGDLDQPHVGRPAPGHAARRREELTWRRPAGARPPLRRRPPRRRAPVFEIEGLHIDYTTELGVLHAVRDVSLTVHEHESFGLVGESGSGKSTLAMGAIRYLASNGKVTDGSVRLNGVELLSLAAPRSCARCGARASASSTRAR